MSDASKLPEIVASEPSGSLSDLVPETQLINRLVELFNQGHYLELEHQAILMTAQFPGHGFGWKVLGVAIKEQGRLDESLEPMLKAADLLPEDAQIHVNIGVTLHAQGRLVEAAQSYRQALKIKADYAQAHCNLGVLLHEQGRYDEAEASFHQALRIKPDDAMTYNSLGNVFQDQGRFVEAEASYRQALVLAADLPEIHTNLGSALQSLGQWSDAAASFRQALLLDPNCVDATVGLGEVLARIVPSWHVAMINDEQRNDAYLEALRAVVTPESRVLEIGTGSGLLALMAAKLGAAVVTTCESVPMIAEVAKQVVANNGFSAVIDVIAKESRAIEVGVDLPQQANLLVSEIFSSELLGEGVLPTIVDARQRLLTADAIIIPQAGSLIFALCGGEELKKNTQVDEVCGFDLRAFNGVIPHKILLHRQDLQMSLFSDDVEAFCFDFTQSDYFVAQSRILRLSVTQAGRVYGVIQWLRLRMNAQITFENHPSARSAASGWQYCFYRFAEAIDVVPGQVVRVQATHNQNIPWFTFEGLESTH